MAVASFLGIDDCSPESSSVQYAVLPLPYERTVSYGAGTADGPAAILRASLELEDFDLELKKPVNIAVCTLPAPVFQETKPEDCLAGIQKLAAAEFRAGRFPVSLGGEHSLTAPLVRAARDQYQDLAVLHLDAHADLRDKYDGTEHSHACVMRRVTEMGIPLVSAGIRSYSAEEFNYMKQLGSQGNVLEAELFFREPMNRCLDRISNVLSSARYVYVSVDVDVFDPSLVPGTGTPEPGGLTWQQVLAILRHACCQHEVIGADVVETSPVPGSQVSEYTAARLALKTIMYSQLGRRPDR